MIAPPPLAAWPTRVLRVGFGLGLSVAALGQGAVMWLAPSGERFGPAIRAAAVLGTTAVFSFVALLLGLITAPAARRRWIAVAVCTLALTVLVAHHTAMVGVRVLTGTFPTLAGLEMFWNSPSQFFHAAMVGHAAHMLLLLAVAVAAAGGLAALLARGGGAAPRTLSLKSLVAVELGLGALLALFALAPARTPEFRGLMLTAPELALVNSLVGAGEPAGAGVPALTASGPPLGAHAAWEAALRASTGPRPNVLLLMLESVPADHLGLAGYGRPVTPNLDRIAARSLRYTRAWTASTQSNYAQMAILSSLHPRRKGGLDMYTRIDYPRVLFHDVFHLLGYATATVSSQNENWQGMRKFQDTGTPTFYRDSNDHPGPHIGAGDEKKLPDHLTVDVLLDWLEKQKEGRWAAYVNFQRTHFPYQLPEGFRGPWQPSEPDPHTFGFLSYPPAELQTVVNRFDNALAYVDAQVGRIEEWLARHGQLRDTLWVITPDHGESFYEHGVVTHGKTLHEEQARVPIFLHWPRRLAPGAVDIPVSQLDILPTILDLVGVPAHPAFQGRSFATPAKHREARTGVFLTLQGLRAVDGLVCWPWKLLLDHTDRVVELHDLASDPDENHDLFDPDDPRSIALFETLTTEIDAQLAYHATEDRTRRARFAPRLLPCPENGDGRGLRTVKR